jgi:outer membrane autotransporter protein
MKKTENRRTMLHGRASVLAIVAMAASAPAQAAGPFFIDASSCPISASNEDVFANSAGRSIHVTSTGDVKSDAENTLDFFNSTFSGSVLNQGLIAFGSAHQSRCSGSAIGTPGAAVYLESVFIPEGFVNDTTGEIVSEALGVVIIDSLIGPEGGEAATQTFKNLGSIVAEEAAVTFQGSSIVGTLFNGGTIRSTNGDALTIRGAYDESNEECQECEAGGLEFLPTIDGSLVNEGEITSDLYNAVVLDDVFVENKVLNTATGQIEGGPFGAGILVSGDSTINQGIENQGEVFGRQGVRFTGGGTYTGGMTNTGLIKGDDHGVQIDISNYYGGLFNGGEGGIVGDTGLGVFAGGSEGGSIARFEGGFSNAVNARITGERGAVLMFVDSLNTDFENAGTMAIDAYSGSGSGLGNFSVFRFDTNYYSGDFKNTGLIDGRARQATNGAVLRAGTIDGDVSSTGQIFASASSGSVGLALVAGSVLGDVTTGGTIRGDTALSVSNRLPGSGAEGGGASIDGNFTNSGLLNGTTTGAIFEFTNWTGDFKNNAGGQIVGGVTGVFLSGNAMSGSVINNGLISGGGIATGFHLAAASHTGAITNGSTGVMDAASLALHLEIDNLTGNILNNGLVEATASNGVAALFDNNGGTGSYAGGFTNNGSVKGGTASGTGLRIETSLRDGVLNTGLLKGKTAYDTQVATGATAFVQQGPNALVDGDMRLSQSFEDSVTFKGGALKGSIFGGGGDDDVAVDTGAQSFAFNGIGVTGIDAFTAQTGVSLLGAETAGTDGLGMTMSANAVTVKTGAEMYVDDNTVITTRSLDVENGATLTYFLTQNVNQHGVINVVGPNPPLPAALGLPGEANIDGTIRVHLNNYGAFQSSSIRSYLYTGVIQTTDGINGRFDVVAYAGNVPLGFQYTVEAIYDPAINPNQVDLRLFRTAFDELIEDPSQNQGEVGEALNDACLTAPPNSPLEDFCNYVGFLPESGIPDAFDQIAGFQIPQLSGLGLDLTELLTLPSNENNVHGTAFGTCQQAGFGWCGTQQYASLGTTATDAMPEEDPFAWLRPGKRQVGKNGVWGRYVGNWRNVEGDANARGVRARTDAFAAGYDHVVAEDLMIGVAGLYAETGSKIARAPADKGDISTYQAGLYASWGSADFYVNANATAIMNQFETRRRIQTGPATFVFADGDFDGFGGTAFVEMGTVIESDGLRLQPLASVFYLSHTTDEFAESGAPTLNLLYKESTSESLRTSLGARLSYPFKWGDTRVSPELRAAWRHEFLDVRQDSDVAFVHAPAIEMKIVGSESARDMAVLGFGLSASLGRETVLYSDVDGAFNADKNSVQASVGVRHSW